MSPEDSSPAQRAPSAAFSGNISLSKYVNERFPAWEQLLSAHDIARLTRRPRWVLLGMMMLRQFPRKHRFHGRGIGWWRADVLNWIAKDLRTASGHRRGAAQHRSFGEGPVVR
jgi:predicted DNA-binding transcriptional regulator AlpA